MISQPLQHTEAGQQVSWRMEVIVSQITSSASHAALAMFTCAKLCYMRIYASFYACIWIKKHQFAKTNV